MNLAMMLLSIFIVLGMLGGAGVALYHIVRQLTTTKKEN